MQPKLELLTPELIGRILDEAFQLMLKPGIKVQSAEARQLLAAAGAQVDGEVVKIPEKVVRKALESVPSIFYLYDRHGKPKVTYGGDVVHFDPGSSGVHILDPDTLEHKPSYTPDLVRVVKVAEMLPQYTPNPQPSSAMRFPRLSVISIGFILFCSTRISRSSPARSRLRPCQPCSICWRYFLAVAKRWPGNRKRSSMPALHRR